MATELVEITPRSWLELMEVLFENSWRTDLRRFRLPYVFRGLSDATYDLKPSIMRVGAHYRSVEPLLLSDFYQYARLDVPAGTSEWSWLTIAQHHGLPTRLLDWTYSPYVALHFATNDVGTAGHECDGVVWCVNYRETNSLLPSKLADELKALRKGVFTVETLARVAPDLRALDELQSEEFVLFIEPPSLDARIVNQVALFSVISHPASTDGSWPTGRIDEVLRRAQANRVDGGEAYLRKVIIRAALKWEIRDKLDQVNITERVLFPGLDGLSA
jgi:hypothetical protein